MSTGFDAGESAPPGSSRAVGGTEPVEGTESEAGARRPARARGKLSRLLPRPIWRIGRLLIAALIIEYLVVPQLAGPRKLIHLLAEVNPLLLLAGVALEFGAWFCYVELTMTLLPDRSQIGMWTLARIQMTTLSVSHSTPGGSATGTALGYRLMTQAGIPGRNVGFALASQGIGSAVILNVILWLALIVSIPVWGVSPIYLLAAIVGILLLGASVALLFLFTTASDRAGAAVQRAGDRLPFVDGPALRRSFEDVARQIQRLASDKRILIAAIVWAAGNWLLDAASLGVFVRAFGHWVNPDGLLVAYGLANVLAAIPITPGGLGVVEATLTSLLVGFDTPRGIATVGVLVYRLVNFWLPIPLGGLAYLSLQVDKTDRTGVRRALKRVRSVWPWARAAEPEEHRPA